ARGASFPIRGRGVPTRGRDAPGAAMRAGGFAPSSRSVRTIFPIDRAPLAGACRGMVLSSPGSAASLPRHEPLSREPRARFGDVLALGFVLDLLPVGIVLLDGRGCVGWTNRRAQERIAEGDPLLVRDGCLIARSHLDTLALHRLVERACTAARSGEMRDAEVLVVSPAGDGGRVVVVARAV